MAKLVPATAEHVKALYGKPLPVTIKGIAGLDDNGVWGLGAIYAESGCMALTFRVAPEARSGLRRKTKAILIGARRLLAEASKTKLPVRCIADRRYPRAVELLEHLGFRHIDKDVYEWTTST